MIRNTYLSLLLIAILSFTSCDEVVSQTNSDLTKMNLPQGTTELVEKTMIYKYKTDEIKPRSTSTYTFNEDGNYLSHIQTYPDGRKNSQEYSYDDQGRLSAIKAYASRTNNTSLTKYSYEGENPQTILITVENGPNYIPKIIHTYEGDRLVKKEVFNNEGVLRELETYKNNEIIAQSYTNSGEPSYKKIIKLEDGNEVKKINYNLEGAVSSGIEKEFDDYGNMTQSWTLDKDMNRDRKSFGYYYTYKDNTWVLRVSKEIRDYGSGNVANIKVREIKGDKNVSISDAEIKKALKAIKL
ncbi:YD repeat-containing protein [Nonlabens dokdonensis]|uniref:Uncharacterized protein n=2 Tax=Nonlabens dokdonensis TaxID=328515 RepID=L7W6F2_NONDD|nr:hypothetical protein [Nonlabens dokdonensis]AGC75757.1 hypothetical protein DDD_0630 [Nonlabens dokdonensis DSW-6]PZX43441.1 YD repeat-containing protein [Nonlabens dokdonensis]